MSTEDLRLWKEECREEIFHLPIISEKTRIHNVYIYLRAQEKKMPACLLEVISFLNNMYLHFPEALIWNKALVFLPHGLQLWEIMFLLHNTLPDASQPT